MKNLDHLFEERKNRQKRIEAIFENFSDLAKQLCSFDWMYINGLNPNDIVAVRELLNIGDKTKIDSFFLIHFETNLKFYKEKLISLNQKRASILIEIFKGIDLELFYLVIPAMTALIEGITKEKTGEPFFGTNNHGKETKLKKKVDINCLEYFNKFMSHPINTVWEYSRLQDHKMPSELNRHDIVHGASINYGTKIPCYKYLSLLLFVTENLDRFCEER